MQTPGLLVIGSGPAGLSAAATFREHNTDAPVTMLTDDPALPYQRPPLSKEFLRGEAEAADARLQEADWFTERDIDIRVGEVTGIDTAARQVTTTGGTHPYRWLVIASGSRPAPPSMPGGERALLLRSLKRAHRLRDAAKDASSAVVIGAGFIGCQAAASLGLRGIATTLVAHHDVPQVKRLGRDAGERIAAMIADAGARVLDHHRRADAEVPLLGGRLRQRLPARARRRLHRLVRSWWSGGRGADPRGRRGLRPRGTADRRAQAAAGRRHRLIRPRRNAVTPTCRWVRSSWNGCLRRPTPCPGSAR